MKRFLLSFAALTVSMSFLFAAQLTFAQQYPTQDPPNGNIAPTFSGLNVSGLNSNTNIEGFLTVGNRIRPTAGKTLTLDGDTTFSKSLNVTNNFNVNGSTNINALKVNKTANFADDVYMDKGMQVNGDLTLGGLGMLKGIKQIDTPADLTVQAASVWLKMIKNDRIRMETASGSMVSAKNDKSVAILGDQINLSPVSGSASTNVAVTGNLASQKIGDWQLVKNNVDLKSHGANQVVSAVAQCPANYIITSCNGSFYFSTATNDKYLGSFITPGSSSCTAMGIRTLQSSQSTTLLSQAMCFNPAVVK